MCVDGVTLPKDGDLEPCPPCNVGMQLVNGTCQFCKANEYSDGLTECKPCPGSTTPETAVVLKQWSNLPKNANITLRCMSLREAGLLIFLSVYLARFFIQLSSSHWVAFVCCSILQFKFALSNLNIYSQLNHSFSPKVCLPD